MHDAWGGSGLERYAAPAGAYARIMRSSDRFPFNHVTRHYQRRIIHIIREMRPGETWDEASERMRKRYESLVTKAVNAGEAEADARRRLEAAGTLLPVFYKRYYWSAYTRLD